MPGLFWKGKNHQILKAGIPVLPVGEQVNHDAMNHISSDRKILKSHIRYQQKKEWNKSLGKYQFLYYGFKLTLSVLSVHHLYQNPLS